MFERWAIGVEKAPAVWTDCFMAICDAAGPSGSSCLGPPAFRNGMWNALDDTLRIRMKPVMMKAEKHVKNRRVVSTRILPTVPDSLRMNPRPAPTHGHSDGGRNKFCTASPAICQVLMSFTR